MARLISADVIFDSDQFIKMSVQVRHATVSEQLPLEAIGEMRMSATKLSQEHYSLLQEFYTISYPDSRICDYMHRREGYTSVGPAIRKFLKYKVQGDVYRCAESISQRGSFVQALFQSPNGDDVQAWPGQIAYFFQHDLQVHDQKVTHTFAFARWLKSRSNSHFINQGVEVWENMFSPLNWQSIVPLVRLYSPVPVTKYTAPRSTKELLVIVPLQKKCQF